jgi:hypothetical protein
LNGFVFTIGRRSVGGLALKGRDHSSHFGVRDGVPHPGLDRLLRDETLELGRSCDRKLIPFAARNLERGSHRFATIGLKDIDAPARIHKRCIPLPDAGIMDLLAHPRRFISGYFERLGFDIFWTFETATWSLVDPQISFKKLPLLAEPARIGADGFVLGAPRLAFGGVGFFQDFPVMLMQPLKDNRAWARPTVA